MELEHSCLNCIYNAGFACIRPGSPGPINSGFCLLWEPKNFNEYRGCEPEPKTIHTYKQIKVLIADNHKSFEEKINEKLKEDWELVDFKVYDYILYAIVSKEFEEEI